MLKINKEKIRSAPFDVRPASTTWPMFRYIASYAQPFDDTTLLWMDVFSENIVFRFPLILGTPLPTNTICVFLLFNRTIANFIIGVR